MPRIITKGESRLRLQLIFNFPTVFCISISFSLLKTMIFIYNCQENSVNFTKKVRSRKNFGQIYKLSKFCIIALS